MRKAQYQSGNTRNLIFFIADLFKAPREYVYAMVVKEFPELKIKEVCPNCGASMASYSHELDEFDAELLLSMARVVDTRKRAFKPFQEAN